MTLLELKQDTPPSVSELPSLAILRADTRRFFQCLPSISDAIHAFNMSFWD